MNRRVGLALLCALTVLSNRTRAADSFQQLKGREITGRFSEMELTDETHWSYVFARSGVLKIHSMGKKSAGRWHVEGNQLCIKPEPDEVHCSAVWISGTNVQLRPLGSDVPVDGVLMKPRKHSL